MTGFVLYVLGFVLRLPRFVLNMTGFVLNVNLFRIIVIEIFLFITGFVLKLLTVF